MQEEYNALLHRIVAGAKYIKSIGSDHPKYDTAMRKYDGLYAEAGELQKQLRKGA